MVSPFWRLRGQLLRLICPLFFEKLGAGTIFVGKIRLPMTFRRIWLSKGCMVGDSVFFQTGRASEIIIGNDVRLNTGTHVVAADSIRISSGTAIGEYVSIRDQDHRFTPSTGVRGQSFEIAPREIGENCWIGRGVHLGPGGRVGAGCIIATNSVV